MAACKKKAKKLKVAMSSFLQGQQQQKEEKNSRGRRVMYFVDHRLTRMEYAANHVMRPVRLLLLHSLVHSLGLASRLTVCRALPASSHDLMTFHPPEFVHFLQSAEKICSDPCCSSHAEMQREFNASVDADSDCPLFPSLWEVVQSYCGASLACADALRRQATDVAINWSGGMHHANQSKASGFCYANDIVLCINELLKSFLRVLYVDIDVHHGDGVDVAFQDSPRVFTYSIHQFGAGFFPGTGSLAECGHGPGAGFSLNIPLPARVGDSVYSLFFRSGLFEVVRAFDPQAVVMQCGADTIAGDLIGKLNVSTHAHAQCVSDVLSLKLPTVLLGGGGYNVLHTAKCWAIHTAVAVGLYEQLPHYIPRSDRFYREYRAESVTRPPTVHVFAGPPIASSTSSLMRRAASSSSSTAIGNEVQAAALFAAFLPHLASQMAAVRVACGAVRLAEMSDSSTEEVNDPDA